MKIASLTTDAADRPTPTIVEVYTRIFVEADAIDATIAFYTGMLGGRLTQRFAYPDKGLELAAVSAPALSVLIIAGPPERRAPFEATRLTIKVERLEPFVEGARGAGAEQLEPIQKTPVGRKTRFRHPDGLVAEYVDQDAAPAK